MKITISNTLDDSLLMFGNENKQKLQSWQQLFDSQQKWLTYQKKEV